ncbi:5-hydroxytryptamine receptor 3A-like [Polymixia lowei]
MSVEEWNRIFQPKINDSYPGHCWKLEFDDSIEGDKPNPGWQQYIRNTSARRGWPSNRVMVVFHMQLLQQEGTVKARRFRQNCKKCHAAPMELGIFSPDNLDILLEKLVEKIRIKCYHEDPAPCNAIMLKCRQPNPPALLEALTPVLKLNSIRPVKNMYSCTNVSTSFILYGILGVDEKAQLLTTYIWLNFEWQNEYISWDPVQCGTDKISLPRSDFWVPDVVINEFMDRNTAPSVPYVYLHHDGYVHDSKPVKVVSSCNLNIYTFPFDIQNCTLTFNSYIHQLMDLKMNLGRPVEDILESSREVMTTTGEWQLLDITYRKEILGSEDGFAIDEIIFNIVVRRRATLYVVNLLIPSCFLITVDLFSFLLPPQSVDRSSFKMTLILGYTVFLLIMNDLLPVTGNTIPLINVFFSLCLALMVASLLETILITNLLCGASNCSPVPCWVRVLVLQFLGCLVGLPLKPKQQSDTEMNAGPVVAEESKADEKPPETEPEKKEPEEKEPEKKVPPEKEPELEDEEALEELKKLGKDLQAIRVQVDQQVTGNQVSEEWIQVGFIIDRLLFALYILFISVSFITIICIWVNSYSR